MYILLITAFVLNANGEPTPRMHYELTKDQKSCVAGMEETKNQLDALKPIVVAYTMDCQPTDMVEG